MQTIKCRLALFTCLPCDDELTKVQKDLDKIGNTEIKLPILAMPANDDNVNLLSYLSDSAIKETLSKYNYTWVLYGKEYSMESNQTVITLILEGK